jgi:8-oxo-dGTP pyrophosphatase MutT (NUDIX family)
MTAGFAKGPERIVYDGAIIRVAVGEFTTPAGERIERDIVRHPGAVAVVPVVGDEAILVRQYRAALDLELLEIPAGKRDVSDEPPERCAERELAEEIGMHPGRLEVLSTFYNSAGFCDEEIVVFLGTELVATDSSAHGVEEQYMTIERVRLDDVPRMIAAGELRDAKSIIGLLLALRRLGR